MDITIASTPEVTVIGMLRASILTRRVVDELGAGYVYTDHFEICQNFDAETGAPRCIVGHVLAALGVAFDDCRHGGAVTSTVRELLTARPDIRFTHGAVLFLTAAQTAQDNGVPWGKAWDIASATSASVTAVLGGLQDQLWPLPAEEAK